MNKVIGLVCGVMLLLVICAGPSQAYEPPCTKGTVWNITFVKTVEGLEDLYLEELREMWKPIMEEALKEKVILSFRIFSSPASTPGDWDLMLMMEFENFAALDGIEEKMMAIFERLAGEEEEFEEGAAKRNEIREILGDKLAIELFLK